MASTLGARLRRLREAKKLTLQQVADAVGCTKAYIWELEINLLAKVLGVTMEDLMNESNEQVPEATVEDVAFFRQYATMSDDEKNRVQDMMKLMFPGTAQEEPKR